VTEQSVGDVVLAMADADPGLSERAKLLILAALDSDEALAAELEHTGPAVSRPTPEPEPVGRPARAFLTSIEVSGFRGVGAKATLPLAAEAGLIIVAGRNGSGKSSFAEAAELALTGDSYRWADRPAQWMSAWRNLHEPDPCAIRIGLAEEGVGATTIGVDWAPDAELDDRTVWTQRPGGKRETGIQSLGWTSVMDLYRPILSYEELGRLLDGRPKELYEAMERILGLGQVNEATRRLAEQLKRLREPEAAATKLKATLRPSLTDLDDPRAADALAQLKKHKPDLDLVSSIATGTGITAGDLAVLRGLTTLAVPNEGTVRSAVHTLRTAVGTLAEHSTTTLALAGQTAALLRQAIDMHDDHGTMPCPICGTGVLDDDWRATAAARAAEADTRMEQLTEAQNAMVRSRTEVKRLVAAVPVLPNVDLATLAAARTARGAWATFPGDDLELADHVERQYLTLTAAFDALRVEASDVLKQREDAWTPVAEQLSTWVGLKRQAAGRQATTDDVAAASTWITTNAGALRNQRLLPLADKARRIWAQLRQESNVDLGSITLEGKANQRHLSINATVDGTDTTALAVMSQGELHALALALFLPRATMPESPLRFIVLDDPVQAMDPAKIDGFVHVLSELARERQVIVFSHDDRLADVVRRTTDNGQILEVVRETDSRVSVRRVRKPALRYLDDVRALLKDEKNIPDTVIDRVVPGMCRRAIEAAARQRYYRERITAGADRVDVERTWSDITSTTKRVSLALFGDADSPNMGSWRDAKSWRRRTLKLCTTGVHQGSHLDRDALPDLISTLRDILPGVS
jgi:ABC-type branched-subunit amino acid transport system ATPase component